MLRGGGETTSEDRGLGLLRLELIRVGLATSLCEFLRGSVTLASCLSTTMETRRPPAGLLFVIVTLESLEKSGKFEPRLWREGADASAAAAAAAGAIEGNGVYPPSTSSGARASACSITVPKLAYSTVDCPDDDDVDMAELFSPRLLLDSAWLSSCPCSCMVMDDIDLEERLRFPVVEKGSSCWEGCGGRGGEGANPSY